MNRRDFFKGVGALAAAVMCGGAIAAPAPAPKHVPISPVIQADLINHMSDQAIKEMTLEMDAKIFTDLRIAAAI